MTVYSKVHAHIMLTQMNIQIGLQTFDRKGNDANLLQQLHNKKAFIQRADISYQDIKKALRYLGEMR